MTSENLLIRYQNENENGLKTDAEVAVDHIRKLSLTTSKSVTIAAVNIFANPADVAFRLRFKVVDDEHSINSMSALAFFLLAALMLIILTVLVKVIYQHFAEVRRS